MTDLLSALREFRVLEDRRASGELSPPELARWQELRAQLGARARLVAPPPEIRITPPSQPPPATPAPVAQLPPAPIAEPAPTSPVPAPRPLPLATQPSLASRFPSLMALEAEVVDPSAEGSAEGAFDDHREKTLPGFRVADLPGAQLPLQELETEADVKKPSDSPGSPPMPPVTLKGPVPPLALGPPIAPAVPGDFDAPVTPIVFGDPVPPGAPLAVGSVDAEAIVESAWRDAGEGTDQAPAAPPGRGPTVSPIPLGSPIAPATESEAEGQGGGIPLETVPYPAIRARLKPVKPPEAAPEPPATPVMASEPEAMPLPLIPAPEPAPLQPTQPPGPAPLLLVPASAPIKLIPDAPPAMPDWLPSEPLPQMLENRPPPPTPILLVQPAVALGRAADLQPEARLPPAPTASWIGPAEEDDAYLPIGVPHPALPPLAEVADPAALFGNPQQPDSVIPGEHRVVVHTVAGPLKRGTLRNPDLAADRIDLVLPNGGVEELSTSLIRDIFFMLAPGQAGPPHEGRRTTVSFADGRQISGFCPEVSDNQPGFFILPEDSRTNTARIYVFRGAVKDIVEG